MLSTKPCGRNLEHSKKYFKYLFRRLSMIEVRNNEHLYYICNQGCDDTTHGLAIIKDDAFAKFKQIIENLNKNSTYGCMPKISVYKIDADFIEDYDSENSMDYEKLYLNDHIFQLAINSWELDDKGEKVI